MNRHSKTTVSLLMLLAAAGSLATPQNLYAQITLDASAEQLGGASPNSSDRLAVLNLVNSYGPLYDAASIRQWRDLFTATPVIEFWGGGTKLAEGIEAVMAALEKRHAEFRGKRIQRRHLILPRITSQASGVIAGSAYLLLLANDGTKPTFVGMGNYEFTAVKEGQNWRISRWIAHLDNALD